MSLAKQIFIGVLIAGGPAWALADDLATAANTKGTASQGWVAKGDWQRRVLQRGPTTRSGPEQAEVDRKRIVRWSPARPDSVRTASRTVPVTAATASPTARTASRTIQTAPEEIPPGDEQMNLAPLPAEDAYETVELGGPEMVVPGPGAPGEVYYEGCGDQAGGYATGPYGLQSEWWAKDLSLYIGGHGFKGPFDRGRNGSFGLHEGVNLGAPLGGPWGWGYQVGFTATHSNFTGDQVTLNPDGQPVYRRADRDQFFFTAGLFHRALCGGIQWGVAFDLLRDVYYANADMKQIRHEIGYVFAGGRKEIGYMGAYGVGDDELQIDGSNVSLEPTDMFTFYFRRQFEGGGEGRFWAGFTGRSDALLGADLHVPLGRSWALENRIGYLLPRQGQVEDGQNEESWSLSVRLILYLGQRADCAQRSPHRPLLGVADNSVFMFDYIEQ